MPVAFQSLGTVGIGSTSVTAGLPASLATGDGVLLRVMAKPDTVTIDTPTDWTLVVDVAGGGGTQGNGTGPSRQAVFWREKDAGWSTMPAVTVTGGNAAAAVAERWTKDTGSTWSLTAASGAYSGNGTAWSATLDVTMAGASGDMISVGCSNQDDAPTWSAQGITATGATHGSVTERSDVVSTTTGQDVGGMVFTAAVTAGLATAPAVVTATTSAASRGTTAAVRLRQTPSFVDDFNRANGAVGSNWGVLNGSSLTIVSNEVASPDTATNHMRTLADSPSANMYAQVEIRVGGAIGVGVRFPSTLTETGYVWRYNGTECTLFRVTTGSFTSISSAYTATLPAGTILRIEAEGSTIRGLTDGVTRVSVTDATNTGTRGSLRMGSSTTVRGDNFSMGALVAAIPVGSGTGTWAFTGAAAGAVTKRGTGTGSWAFAGSASGATTKQGTSSGTWTTTGTATGTTTKRGTGAGMFAFLGAAIGAIVNSGTGTGAWAYIGSAVGEAPGLGVPGGLGVGLWGFTGTAAGTTTKGGTGSGTWAFTGTGVGLTPPIFGDTDTPATRTRVIPFDNRTRSITSESRTRTIPAQPRTRSVPSG